jgi:hypothetical protein
MQFTQCNSLSNNRTLRFEGSARLKALSNMTYQNPQFGIGNPGGACSKVNLFSQRSKKFTFEHSDNKEKFGGADRDRTDDPLLAKQVLSQLSYSPMQSDKGWWAWVDSNYRPHPYQGCALTN